MSGVEGARLLENEFHIFFVRYNAAEAFLVLRDERDRGNPQALAPRFSARPAEREQPEMEINHSQGQQRLRKQLNLKGKDGFFQCFYKKGCILIRNIQRGSKSKHIIKARNRVSVFADQESFRLACTDDSVNLVY